MSFSTRNLSVTSEVFPWPLSSAARRYLTAVSCRSMRSSRGCLVWLQGTVVCVPLGAVWSLAGARPTTGGWAVVGSDASSHWKKSQRALSSRGQPKKARPLFCVSFFTVRRAAGFAQ